ncbi:MAG: SpoIIE family protein phosphatase [Candidatus Hydrogenedentales bacterium]
MRILVVDDEPDLEALIRQRFRGRIREGRYDFLFARSGVEALDKLRDDESIEVVLTDINMPEMDGLTLLSHLSKLEAIRKSLIVSAYGDMENIRAAMNRGAFDFITKPIDFKDLEITLEKTRQELETMKQARDAREDLSAVQRELDVAARIQQAILPQTFPPFPDRSEFEIYAEMIPARQIGGDFYDFFFISEHRLGIVIGDVAGKGMPAALFMAVCRTLLKATAVTGMTPGDCLRHVNTLVCADNGAGLFVTLVYGILDTRTGIVEYSIAGHLPPILIGHEGAVRELPRTGGLVLGVAEDAAYETDTIKLQPREGLLLYTDGVSEAMDEGHTLFSEPRLMETVTGLQSLPPDVLIKGVVSEVRVFTDGHPQSDDITLLAMRYLGAQRA